jgi:hypothetical protein
MKTELEEVAEKLKGKELFKESNDKARQTLSEIKSLPIQKRSYSEEEVKKIAQEFHKKYAFTHATKWDCFFEKFKKE